MKAGILGIGVRREVTWLLAVLLLLTATRSVAQGLTNSFRIENTLTNLRLNYSLANSNGAFFFLQSGQLNDIFSAGQVIASGIAASNPVGTITAGLPTNTASFFGLLHDPTLSVSPEDFTSIEDGDVPEAAVNLLIESPNLPDVLTANSPFPLTLNITDTNGTLVFTNGQITLSLENGDGTPVTFAYTLLPATVGVTNGIAQTILTIQTTNSLASVFVSGKFTGQLPGAASRDAASGAQIGCANVTYGDYSDPEIISWRYPLPAVVPISGAFGEWPGHSDIHCGIDFKATSGTSVLAAKKGVVVKIGFPKADGSQGQYVVIYHGNGYVTRYLHITPKVKLGCVVTSGQVIGTVYNWAHPHLHFEMLQLNNPAVYNSANGYRNLYNTDFRHTLGNFPGVAANPIGNPAFTFSLGLFTSGGQLPLIKAVFFRASHPALTALRMDPANACLERLSGTPSSSPVYVVLQVVEETAGGVLPPKQITFTPDVGSAANIVYGLTETDIEKLDPRGWTQADGPGYALLPDNESNPNTASTYRTQRYKYWFAWDTSQYIDSPHSFKVQAVDLAGNVANPVVFTFGPQITSLVPNQLVPGQYVFDTVAYLGTNSLPALTQPDRYKMEIIQANGMVLPGVQWGSPIQNGLTPVLTTHLQANSYTFTLPANTIPDGLKLRVSSRMAPTIAHQISLSGMALIPEGSFTMGNSFSAAEGSSDELPLHSVYVSAFYMDQYEVTKAMWDEVYGWAITHGYSFDNAGLGKAATHPVHTVSWYDCVKWCNARSEKEGRVPAYYTDAGQTTVYRNGTNDIQETFVKWNTGFRLPTEAEWEKSARAGASGHRFPWNDTDNITHSQANYWSITNYVYDTSPTRGLHPTFTTGGTPFTSPAGYFAPNDYGLYDMAGNVWEWCWDWYSSTYYSSSPGTDPHGPTSGSRRVNRGGSWAEYANHCRSAYRSIYMCDGTHRCDVMGFRSVLPVGQ